jgi:hypothetical protein
VKFILIPKKSIIADTQNRQVSSANNSVLNTNISNVLHFVVDNFPVVYEDHEYVILKVLPFTPPSPDSNVAFVYQKDFDLSNHISNTSVILPTDTIMLGSQVQESSTKNNSDYNNNIIIKKFNEQNKSEFSNFSSLILGGNASNINSKSITLWSNPIQSISDKTILNNSKGNRTLINYMENNFRIIDDIPAQNTTEQKNANNFGTGILWDDNNWRYLVSISDTGLKLSRGPAENISVDKHPEVLDKNKKQGLITVLSQNEEIKRQKGIWYNIKILILKTGVEIYVDDILRIKISASDYYPVATSERNTINNSISRIGINTYYSKSEFQPIILGHLPEPQSYSNWGYQKMSYGHYYPLNFLALSKVKYDTYLDGDLTAFSKRYVVIPFDIVPDLTNETINYLEFAAKGGNLIVINSDNTFDGIISKLLGIRPGNLTKFNGIEAISQRNLEQKKYIMNVTGIVRSIDINSNDNLTIKSYYVNKDNRNNYQNVVPFVIEKKYGDGKIIFVNAKGYFDSIFGTPFSSDNMTDIKDGLYFTNLSNFNSFIGIPNVSKNNDSKTHPITLSSMSKIIGDLKLNTMQTITINGSSLLFPDSTSDSNKTSIASYNLTANRVSVSSSNSQQLLLKNESLVDTLSAKTAVHNSSDSNWLKSKSNKAVADNNYHFKNMVIKNLKLYGGPFEITINSTNSTRPMYFPITSSYDDYVAMSIPRDFDVTINFIQSNSTYAQLDMLDDNEKNAFKSIKVLGHGDNSIDSENGTVQIALNKVRTDIKSVRYITVLMKDPEINVISGNKNITKDQDHQGSSIQFKRNTPESVPTEIGRDVGNLKFKVDHVDNYDEAFHKFTKTQFITYLKNDIQITNMAPHIDEPSLFTKLMSKKPGDISESAKQNGIEVPWRKVLHSINNMILALMIMFITSFVIILSWYKIKLQSIR